MQAQDETPAQSSVDDQCGFQVRAMKIGLVLACVVLDARRVRRDGAENAETNDFHGNRLMTGTSQV